MGRYVRYRGWLNHGVGGELFWWQLRGRFYVQERGLIGLEARYAGGEELGRISEIITDETSGEVTHVLVEGDEESLELPISRLTLDPEADFATVSADPSDDEPRDHAGDEIEPEGYAPAEAPDEEEDEQHEGQLVADPESPREAESEEDVDREDWEDEATTPADSGYPRTDAYIDPETGEAIESYPEAADAESLEEAVAIVLEGTGLQAISVEEGVVELAGNTSADGLDRTAASIMELEEVFDVDTSGVQTT